MNISKHIVYSVRVDFTEEEATLLAWFQRLGIEHFKRSLKIDPSLPRPDEQVIRSLYGKIESLQQEVDKIAQMKKKEAYKNES